MIFETVKYSYTELMEFCNVLNENVANLKDVNSFWIDIENNRIEIAILVNEDEEETKIKILSLIPSDAVSFVDAGPDDIYKNAGNINETSIIK